MEKNKIFDDLFRDYTEKLIYLTSRRSEINEQVKSCQKTLNQIALMADEAINKLKKLKGEKKK